MVVISSLSHFRWVGPTSLNHRLNTHLKPLFPHLPPLHVQQPNQQKGCSSATFSHSTTLSLYPLKPIHSLSSPSNFSLSSHSNLSITHSRTLYSKTTPRVLLTNPISRLQPTKPILIRPTSFTQGCARKCPTDSGVAARMVITSLFRGDWLNEMGCPQRAASVG